MGRSVIRAAFPRLEILLLESPTHTQVAATEVLGGGRRGGSITTEVTIIVEVGFL